MEILKGILIISGVVFPILYFIKLKLFVEMSEYAEFLENEYTGLIDLLDKSNAKEKNELINKAKKSKVYNYTKTKYLYDQGEKINK